MDDIRRPQRPERRDYALPSRPKPSWPANYDDLSQAQSPQPPRPPAPPPNYRPHPAPQPRHHQQPVHHPGPTQHQPQPQHHPASQPQHHQPAHRQPQTNLHQQKPAKKRFAVNPLIVLGIVLAGAAIFAAVYLLRSSAPQDTIPTKITRQVNYNLYFPSPMPAGYTYMSDTATFQIGQVFYKFANGKKRVTVKEEPMPETKPDLSLLGGYTQFSSPVGKAAVGMSLGESNAVIITDTTVITMNTTGGVSQQELKTAISNLKNIGENPHKT